MNAAIYYAPEAYTTSGPNLMGRNAAGESFLRGFLTHSSVGEFWLQVETTDHVKSFVDTARALGRDEAVKAVDRKAYSALTQPGAVYFPGPGIGGHAWRRAGFGHHAWSLCGITHTTSSALAMDSLTELLTAPVQPWDALICTSHAVKDNVTRVLHAQAQYLEERLGVTRLVLPQLPIIPLGVHTQDFAFTHGQRAAARQALSIPDDAMVVLFMGRLSFHAKAHPLAMYQALERAAQVSGKSVVLVECGWHANAHIAKAFQEAAALACPSVRVIRLEGRDADSRQSAWACADVFCSLSDNIQETFGITPIEAMAAGLPVVVSDWDGYKDTVRHEVDGFRVPTLTLEGGLAADLAMRHALEIDTYDLYCGYTCSLVAVDIQAAADAFSRLFQSPDLRARMGQAGRQRAREVYDWACIIPQYEALWAQLAEVRRTVPDGKRSTHPWPARMDPFHAFASYPSQTLTTSIRLARADADINVALTRMRAYQKLAMVEFANAALASDAEIVRVITAADHPKPAIDLVADVAADRQAIVFRSLAWLIKLGVLKVSE